MFFDPFLTDEDDGITPARAAGTSGEKVTLTTNSFRIVWEGKDSYIFQYQYDLPDRDISQQEEKKLLEQVWGDLKQKLTHFIVRCPGEIFSPKLVPDFSVAVKGGDGDETSQFKVSFMSKIHADQINEGIMGTASVVGQHIVRKLAEPLRIQKVGKRYYNNCPQGKTNQLVIIGGFCANMAAVGKAGPLLRLDMTPRLVRKETIANTVLEVCRGNGMDPWAFTEDAVKAEWCKHCVSATVVTSYNSRVYRIKAVHFDMNPADKFTMYHRDSKEYTKLSYAEYLQAFYSMPCTHENQPLLEAYPEKASEQVFLLPEFCSQTGLSPEMRKDKSSYVEALKQLKVAPQDRYEAIITHAKDMCTQQTVMKEWGCYLPSKPLQVEGRLLSSLQVAYKEKKFGTVEEGSWERSLRNGLQCAVKLEKWLLVYPKEDEQVVDIWLGSFRDIAQVAFGLTTAQPTRIVLDTMGQLYTTLKTVMPDRPELVLLLMPHKETKAYMVFKRTMATEFPCISQVVTSETIRKRQNIAKILSRVVLQINAKFGAPLWNIIPPEQAEDSQDFVDFKKTPSMVVGIELHETSCTLGLVATLDNTFSQHFSKAAMMDKKEAEPGTWRSSMTQKLQELFRDALLRYACDNDQVLPETIIVYRGSVNPEQQQLAEVELKALKEVLKVLQKSTQADRTPSIVFITVAKASNLRLFALGGAESQDKAVAGKNPSSGTVVDNPDFCAGKVPNFYLVSQAFIKDSKGTAVPAHYSVLENGKDMTLDFLEQLTHRLCMMYFNSDRAVRLPAPLMYARKLAVHVGTVVKQEPDPSLCKSLFYL